ncbi:MAG TPA: GNAT family N-acetyltransferase, partial [Terrimesophilobacter sp.]|nr:GNAT family N-acetyltransferase [Terrimesophilobacter sp.]
VRLLTARLVLGFDKRDDEAPEIRVLRGYRWTMARELVHEPENHRYALRIDGELASVVDYTIIGTSISFHRTFTPPAYRGQGLAGEVVEFAMDDVEATTDFRVVPMCWYVEDWFDRHPERANLLTRAQ